ncbi:MAG: 4Fe-4S dicluster domain-containing protein [Nitrospirae bacterium]|nr:4Fe-4S dicluster domain-containing protein [Nitrospirota bacterium]
MKVVVVKPERCVGCLQCRFACSVAHSISGSPYAAPYEAVLSKPRIHIGLTKDKDAFPNKCRHCDPAPCEMACLPKAIFREPSSGMVLINPDRCINCGMCAMACPFGVVRYHVYSSNKTAAHKCDQCIARQKEGRVPACVEVCKVGALLFDDYNKVMDRATDEISSLVYLGIRSKEQEKGPYQSLTAYKHRLEELRRKQA